MKFTLTAALLALSSLPATAGQWEVPQWSHPRYMVLDAPRQTAYGEAQVYRPWERSVRWLSEANAPRPYFSRHGLRPVSERDPY